MGVAMSVVEAALLVACGTAAAIALMFFAEAQRRRSGARVSPRKDLHYGIAGVKKERSRSRTRPRRK